MSIFDDRRTNDPQGLIDDMLAQVGRQAKAISDLMKESERLEVLLVEAGIDPKKEPEPKKRRKKKEDEKTNQNMLLADEAGSEHELPPTQ